MSRKEEVSKIHRLICGDVPNSIDDCEQADAIAQYLVDNGIGTKARFKAVEVVDAKEKGLTDFGFVFKIEPKDYKE